MRFDSFSDAAGRNVRYFSAVYVIDYRKRKWPRITGWRCSDGDSLETCSTLEPPWTPRDSSSHEITSRYAGGFRMSEYFAEKLVTADRSVLCNPRHRRLSRLNDTVSGSQKMFRPIATMRGGSATGVPAAWRVTRPLRPPDWPPRSSSTTIASCA